MTTPNVLVSQAASDAPAYQTSSQIQSDIVAHNYFANHDCRTRQSLASQFVVVTSCLISLLNFYICNWMCAVRKEVALTLHQKPSVLC